MAIHPLCSFTTNLLQIYCFIHGVSTVDRIIIIKIIILFLLLAVICVVCLLECYRFAHDLSLSVSLSKYRLMHTVLSNRDGTFFIVVVMFRFGFDSAPCIEPCVCHCTRSTHIERWTIRRYWNLVRWKLGRSLLYSCIKFNEVRFDCIISFFPLSSYSFEVLLVLRKASGICTFHRKSHEILKKLLFNFNEMVYIY